MRCPDCNKFVSLDTMIEEQQIDMDVSTVTDGKHLEATCTVHVSRNCADCGQELKATDFEVELTDVAVEGDPIKPEDFEEVECQLEVSEDESGGGRYQKNMIGFSGTATFKLGERVLATVEVKDSTAASNFEECV